MILVFNKVTLECKLTEYYLPLKSLCILIGTSIYFLFLRFSENSKPIKGTKHTHSINNDPPFPQYNTNKNSKLGFFASFLS